MRVFRSHRRLNGWLVLLAMLWGALSPLLAQAALGGDRGDSQNRIEICTATGMAWIQVAEANSASDPNAGATSGGMAANGMGACAWCLIHGGAPALPPADMTVNFGPADAIESATPLALPARHQAWVHLPSRAPPTVSSRGG